MRSFNPEFVFLPGWWMPDCDQHFVAGWRFGVSQGLGRGNLGFELWLELWQLGGVYSQRVTSESERMMGFDRRTVTLRILRRSRVKRRRW